MDLNVEPLNKALDALFAHIASELNVQKVDNHTKQLARKSKKKDKEECVETQIISNDTKNTCIDEIEQPVDLDLETLLIATELFNPPVSMRRR